MIRYTYLIILILAYSCNPSGNKQREQSTTSEGEITTVVTSFEGPSQLLLQQLRDQGDYVNSRQYPSMIKPSTVHEELGGNNLIIDIRTGERFIGGHIEGAVNVPMDQLLPYFENNIIPFQHDKIILVCDGGQRTSVATNLLRLMGYGNVYSMRWGMCGWHSDFTGYLWESKISSKFQDRLVNETFIKPETLNQPPLESTASSGEAILRERVSKLLSANPKDFFIGSAGVFADPDRFFIINWDRKDKYESGHIPGAIRYKPQGTLGIPGEMVTLPADKTIVIYCDTGMSSGFATAFLRLFGYDARSMSYGNNSFMHRKMVNEQEELSWHPFSKETPGEFPYVTGN